MKHSRIRLSPIPPATTVADLAFTYQLPDGSAQPDADVHAAPSTNILAQAPDPENANKDDDNEKEAEEADWNLSYDNVLSKTDLRLDTTIQAWEEHKGEKEGEEAQHERPSGRYSSSQADQDDEPSINPIKEFHMKAKGPADPDLSLLDSSLHSQRGQDPLSLTNSSIISTYLYKPSGHPSTVAKQHTLPSPSMPISNSTPNIAAMAVNPYSDCTPLARQPTAPRPVVGSSQNFVLEGCDSLLGRRHHGPSQYYR